MKAILGLRPDTRLQTLRKAFGIEDYIISKENSKELAGKVRTRSKELSGAASDIPELESKVAELAASISEKSSQLAKLRRLHAEKLDLLKVLGEKRDDLRAKQLLLKADAGKAEALVALAQEKRKAIKDAERRIGDQQGKINGLEPTISELASAENPSDKNQEELLKEISTLEGEQRKCVSQEAQVRAKVDDYKTILEKGVCPTCDRPVERHSFAERVEHREGELQVISKQLQDCEGSLGRAKKTLEKKRKFDQAQLRLQDLRRSVSEFNENMSTWQGEIKEATNALEKAESDLLLVRASIQKLEQISSELAEIETKFNDQDENQQRLARSISSFETSISGWKAAICGL